MKRYVFYAIIAIFPLVPSCTKPSNASFTYSFVNNSGNPQVFFYASDKNIRSYHWSFGDGTPDTMLTRGIVTHYYAKPGTYTVVLDIKRKGVPLPGGTTHAESEVVIP